MSEFEYDPLNQATGELRLFSFAQSYPEFSTGSDTPIECMLEHVQHTGHQLDPAALPASPWGIFAAFSYVWGSTENQQKITLNEREFEITQNLYNALLKAREYLRSKNNLGMRLWCDAISINQSDMDERNAQVGRMGEIYKGASETLCFLPAYESDPLPCSCEDCEERNLKRKLSNTSFPLECMSQQRKRSPKISLDQLEREWDIANRGLHTIGENSWASVKAVFRHSDWLAIFRFFNNPYWRRIWVVQEVCLSRGQVWFFFGVHKISIFDLVQVSRRILDNHDSAKKRVQCALDDSDEVPSHQDPWVLFFRMDRIRQDLFDGPDWVELVQSCSATQPLDNVYGIVGLLPDVVTRGMIFDYQQKPCDVFTQFGASMVNATSSLEILSCYITRPCTLLPSWVPDLESRFLGGSAFSHWYFDSGEEGRLGNSRPRARGRILAAFGIIVDVVIGLGTPISEAAWRMFNGSRNLEQARHHTQEELGWDISHAELRKMLVKTLATMREDEEPTQRQIEEFWFPDDPTAASEYAKIHDFFKLNGELRIYGKRLSEWSNYLQTSTSLLGPTKDVQILEEHQNEEHDSLLPAIADALSYNRLVLTENGSLGLANVNSAIGDAICYFSTFGSLAVCRPFPTPEGPRWKFIGEAYVHGVMSNQKIEDMGMTVEKFLIV